MADEPMSLTVPGDRERFAELERIIEHGLGTFVEVGRALPEIQGRRLYRAAGHRTFADYVAKRWDLLSAHAYRQIEAVEGRRHSLSNRRDANTYKRGADQRELCSPHR